MTHGPFCWLSTVYTILTIFTHLIVLETDPISVEVPVLDETDWFEGLLYYNYEEDP